MMLTKFIILLENLPVFKFCCFAHKYIYNKYFPTFQNALVCAIGGFTLPQNCDKTYVLFCKDTFEHPGLQDHKFRQDNLGTHLKLNYIISRNREHYHVFSVQKYTQCKKFYRL